MRINVSDMDTGGRTEVKEVEAGMTVGDYFARHKSGLPLDRYRIRVGNQIGDRDTMLYDGCTLTISGSKLAGAG